MAYVVGIWVVFRVVGLGLVRRLGPDLLGGTLLELRLGGGLGLDDVELEPKVVELG